MKINIDQSSGFCFGVVNAIKIAEVELTKNNSLYCLGDIVHNQKEIQRLKDQGLVVVDSDTFKKLKDTKVLIRAHGEPPSTFEIARKNNIELINATCPIVLKLQKNIKKSFNEITREKGQVVIFGKTEHAEVIGLRGQTDNNAIVFEDITDIAKIDFNKPIVLYSQTTKSLEDFNAVVEIIKSKSKSDFTFIDSVCRKVSNRVNILEKFAQENDVIIFVAGKKSSNGSYLYNICKKKNPNSFFVSDINEIQKVWFKKDDIVGVSGATSTPAWLINDVVGYLKSLFA